MSAILPHIRKSRSILLGESQLIARFHADPRVRAFALERLAQPSPPLEAMAGVYSADAEIVPLDTAACGTAADGISPIHCEKGKPTFR